MKEISSYERKILEEVGILDNQIALAIYFELQKEQKERPYSESGFGNLYGMYRSEKELAIEAKKRSSDKK